MAILLLVSRSNQIEDLAPIVPAALTASESILPGQVVRIGEWSSSDCLLGAAKLPPNMHLHLVRGACGQIGPFPGSLRDQRGELAVTVWDSNQ